MERKIHWESMHYDYSPIKNTLLKEEKSDFSTAEEDTLLQLDDMIPVQEMSSCRIPPLSESPPGFCQKP
jgi:hypothetical protein